MAFQTLRIVMCVGGWRHTGSLVVASMSTDEMSINILSILSEDFRHVSTFRRGARLPPSPALCPIDHDKTRATRPAIGILAQPEPTHGSPMPIPTAAALSSREVTPVLPSGKRARVLVVDEHDGIRQTTADILRRGGHLVFEAVDADDAVYRLARGDITVLVVDLGLDQGGLELLDRIVNPPPVIMMSGFDENPSTDPKISVLLIKPVAPGRLLETVESLLGTSD